MAVPFRTSPSALLGHVKGRPSLDILPNAVTFVGD